jgi:hypothetical protein
VEQIEDILRARLRADPYLAKLTVDLGTTPGGGLEIWVDDQQYTDVDAIPDQRLREAIQEVVKEWNAGAWEQPEGQ